MITIFLHLFLLVSILAPSNAIYNIVNFGARPDGVTDSTRALLAAWSAACGSIAPETIFVPVGQFLIGRIIFSGQCRSPRVTIQMDGTLVAPANYDLFGEEWMLFDHVDGVSIFGGAIDGQGMSLWACKASGRTCPSGASSLVFGNSRNILISGLTSLNSKLYHIVINNCQEATVQGVKVVAPATSRNTDGIHVQMSIGVTITGTSIGTGDDCISIGPGTTNLWIQHITCGPGHGISIGSLGKEYKEPGVQNVTVSNVVFTGTENGVRIKTWGRPSTGFVRDVVFEHAIMQDARNPIVINQNYCEEERTCPEQNSGVKITQVTYNDIEGTSATPMAVDFDCSPSKPCTGIILENIRLTFGAQLAQSSCRRAFGTTVGVVIPRSCLVVGATSELIRQNLNLQLGYIKNI